MSQTHLSLDYFNSPRINLLSGQKALGSLPQIVWNALALFRRHIWWIPSPPIPHYSVDDVGFEECWWCMLMMQVVYEYWWQLLSMKNDTCWEDYLLEESHSFQIHKNNKQCLWLQSCHLLTMGYIWQDRCRCRRPDCSCPPIFHHHSLPVRWNSDSTVFPFWCGSLLWINGCVMYTIPLL